MLSLAEFRALDAELRTTASKIEEKVRNAIQASQGSDRLAKAEAYYRTEYVAERNRIIYNGLLEAAINAARHHADSLGLDLSNQEIEGFAKEIVDRQYKRQYYGATLAARLKISDKQLGRRIVRTYFTGMEKGEKLDTVLTKSVPFGAQIHVDRRILLGQIQKVENDIAKEIADKYKIPFIRWTLSHRHTVQDVCDDLANYVDPQVVAQIETLNLDIDPKGLYFAKDLPQPPHPNCQCEFVLVTREGARTASVVKRAARRVRRLLRRLRRK